MLSTIDDALQQFPKIVRKHSKSNTADIATLGDKIKRLRSANPAVFEESKIGEFLRTRAKMLNGLLDEYIIAQMSAELPLVIEDLFKYRRHLHYTIKGRSATIIADEVKSKAKLPEGTKEISVPLFADAPFSPKKDDHPTCVLAETKMVVQRRNSWGDSVTKTTRLKLEVRMPGVIGPEVRASHAKALSHYHHVIAKLYGDPVISETFLARALPSPTTSVIWIPTTANITAKVKVSEKITEHAQRQAAYDPDPAMLLNVLGRRFLVTMWDAKPAEEEPFRNYLQEFTTGIIT